MSEPAHTEADTWAEFVSAMAGAGIRTRDKIAPSTKIIRFHVEGDRTGSKNGWLNFHSDQPASGAYGSFRTGFQDTWTMVNPQRMDESEREALRRRMEDTKRQRAEELAEGHRMCREAAAAIWAAVEPASPEHPYLLAKGVGAVPGLKQLARDVRYTVADPVRPNRTARKGVLVVPIWSADKVLHSVQTIDADGRKHFLSGTNKRSHYHSLGKLTQRIVIAEGTSTAATIHRATGCCVVIAFDAGNLMPVAKAIRAKFPTHEIVLGADNDRQTMKPVPNPGMSKACEAAAEVGGLVAWPEFDSGATLPNGNLPTDFNDLAAVRGNLESVAAAFEAAMRPSDIENHVDPRHRQAAAPAPAPAKTSHVEVVATAVAALPVTRRILPKLRGFTDTMVGSIRQQGFDSGSEVNIAGAFHQRAEQEFEGFVFSEGYFWVYEHDHWRKLDDNALRRSIQKVDGAGIGVTGNKVVKLSDNNVKGIMKSLATMVAEDDFFAFSDPGIPVRNGVVKADDGGRIRIEPHHPDHRRRFIIDVDFDPLASEHQIRPDTLIHKLFYGAFGTDGDHDDKIALVLEAMAAAASGCATKLKQPKAFIFRGETADNGKSTMLSIFNSLLPESAITHISPEKFSDQTFLITLAGKAANTVDELGDAPISGSIFKSAVTGGRLMARDVFRAATSFMPHALHVLSTNNLPNFAGGYDRGILRRLMVIEFNSPIDKKDMIADIAGRICREELADLVGLVVTAFSRLIRQGAYTQPRSSTEGLTRWHLDDDLVVEWGTFHLTPLHTEPASGWPIASKDIRPCFVRWATEHGYSESKLPDERVFTKRLRKVPGLRLLARTAQGTPVCALVKHERS